MAETLTYSPDVKGWPSFYSYIPEWMAGMNNYFYSFKGGNLYRHNTNEVRNQYYGVNYSSQMTSIFNDNPTDNSLVEDDGAGVGPSVGDRAGDRHPKRVHR